MIWFIILLAVIVALGVLIALLLAGVFSSTTVQTTTAGTLNSQYCSVNTDCGVGGTCTQGVCQYGPGYPCQHSNQCAAGVCTELGCRLLTGAACSADVECATLTCNDKTSKCSRHLYEPCTNSAQCDGDLVCTNSLCLLPSGDACTHNYQCASGICAGTCV